MMNWLFKPLKLDRWDDYFEPGEKLIWQGAPEPRARSYLLPISITIAFSPALFTGVLLATDFFERASHSFVGTTPFEFAASLILSTTFLLIAILGPLGSWLFVLNEHKHIRYALTNKRAYIAKSFRRQTVNSYPILPDDIITLDQGKYDNVRFRTGYGLNSFNTTNFDSRGFDGIANGNEVYTLLRRVQSKAS